MSMHRDASYSSSGPRLSGLAAGNSITATAGTGGLAALPFAAQHDSGDSAAGSMAFQKQVATQALTADFPANTGSSRSLYVGNLDPNVTEALLGDVFRQSPGGNGVISAKIIFDKTMNHAGTNYGFVDFADHESAEAAIQSLNGMRILGCDIKVNWAYHGSGSARVDTSAHHHVFVGDLSPEITDANLHHAFSAFGSLTQARVIVDGVTRKSRGYGFLAFRERADAERAIQTMNNAWIGSRPIRVNWATPRANVNMGAGGPSANSNSSSSSSYSSNPAATASHVSSAVPSTHASYTLAGSYSANSSLQSLNSQPTNSSMINYGSPRNGHSYYDNNHGAGSAANSYHYSNLAPHGAPIYPANSAYNQHHHHHQSYPQNNSLGVSAAYPYSQQQQPAQMQRGSYQQQQHQQQQHQQHHHQHQHQHQMQSHSLPQQSQSHFSGYNSLSGPQSHHSQNNYGGRQTQVQSYEAIVAMSPPSNCTIYFGNLPASVREQEIYSYFQPFGYVVEVRLQPERCFAFVQMESHEHAAMAIYRLQGLYVHGRQVKISWGKLVDRNNSNSNDSQSGSMPLHRPPMGMGHHHNSSDRQYPSTSNSTTAAARRSSSLTSTTTTTTTTPPAAASTSAEPLTAAAASVNGFQVTNSGWASSPEKPSLATPLSCAAAAAAQAAVAYTILKLQKEQGENDNDNTKGEENFSSLQNENTDNSTSSNTTDAHAMDQASASFSVAQDSNFLPPSDGAYEPNPAIAATAAAAAAAATATALESSPAAAQYQKQYYEYYYRYYYNAQLAQQQQQQVQQQQQQPDQQQQDESQPATEQSLCEASKAETAEV